MFRESNGVGVRWIADDRLDPLVTDGPCQRRLVTVTVDRYDVRVGAMTERRARLDALRIGYRGRARRANLALLLRDIIISVDVVASATKRALVGPAF